MNSEELELSLRTEFESYLTDVRAEMKRDLVDFRQKVEAEVDKHKSQLDEAFQSFSARLESGSGIDQALKESVVEHLRLARDDGAKLAATAAAEAEKMDAASVPSIGFDEMRDAIADISCKTSQSAILKSLTDHCARFAGRGAFFIVKNDNFVGWQVFGNGTNADENTARDIQIPVSSETILGDAVRSLRTVHGSKESHKGNSSFLNGLKFDRSGAMIAVPLVARGRGVAVLLADTRPEDMAVNAGAIETLVRIASMTVELLAASVPVRPQVDAPSQQTQQATVQETEKVSEQGPEGSFTSNENETEGVHEVEQSETENATEIHTAEAESAGPKPADVVEATTHADYAVPVVAAESLDDESYLMNEPAEEIFEAEEITPFEAEPEFVGIEAEVSSTDFAFVGSDAPESMEFEHVPDDHVEEFPTANGNGNGQMTEPAVETADVVASNGRRRERKIDLPIEVDEAERDKHAKARSFARLLVSEIKLYNPDKVNDGREANDLYDRLREAIDRSREMYNQRVEAPVASRFDYFHYELVNGLAEGDEARLGGSYPGSST